MTDRKVDYFSDNQVKVDILAKRNERILTKKVHPDSSLSITIPCMNIPDLNNVTTRKEGRSLHFLNMNFMAAVSATLWSFVVASIP